jgi:hypothetical protein
MPQSFHAVCPKCSATYELPEEYVTNYGGQTTQIIAICIQKSGKIQVSLCPEHRRRRRYHILGAWLCAGAGVGGIVVAVTQDNGYFALAGSLLLIGAGVWGIIGPAILKPKRIDNNFMWLRGACGPFLETLPELPKGPLVAATPTYPVS